MFVSLIAESVFDLINVSLLVQGIETLMADVLAKNKQLIRDIWEEGLYGQIKWGWSIAQTKPTGRTRVFHGA